MKKGIMITALLLLLSISVCAAGTCVWICAFCGTEIVSGCSPPSSSGYCPRSPKSGQHAYVLVKQL
jgi:hypothetical protein